MNYGIHRVSISEPDDYMDLEMLDDMTVRADLTYILSDPDNGILRIVDIDGNLLRSVTTTEQKNKAFYLFAKLIAEMPAGSVLIAGEPFDISEDIRSVNALYRECLKRGIEIVFRKRPYLDTSNFTGVLTNDNRDTLLTVIEKLLALPIVTNEDIENRVMGRTPGSMNYSQELKKTL